MNLQKTPSVTMETQFQKLHYGAVRERGAACVESLPRARGACGLQSMYIHFATEE